MENGRIQELRGEFVFNQESVEYKAWECTVATPALGMLNRKMKLGPCELCCETLFKQTYKSKIYRNSLVLPKRELTTDLHVIRKAVDKEGSINVPNPRMLAT